MTQSDWFASDGPFAAHIANFQTRAPQQAMAAAIENQLSSPSTLVVEAGTGVGKTFAYLAPILAAEKKAIFSTGSKTLQDQLYQKDLPVVLAALKKHCNATLLKGRANYLCKMRLSQARKDGQFTDKKHIHWLKQIEDWAPKTQQGDIAEVSDIPPGNEFWGHVTSTRDNCIGSDCEHYDDCYVFAARKAAQEADVVIVNHHLFFADLALREQHFGELLPNAEVIVMDEAHQLAEIAGSFFAKRFSSQAIVEWTRDTKRELATQGKEFINIPLALSVLEKLLKDLRLAMDQSGLRIPWQHFKQRPGLQDLFTQLGEQLEALLPMLKEAGKKTATFEKCYERLQEFDAQWSELKHHSEQTVQWLETHLRSFVIHTTPLDVAPMMKSAMQDIECNWIFTSATLAVGPSFTHFNQSLGLEEPETLQLDSPFDYWKNSLMYLPADLPEPNHPDHTTSLIEAAIPVIKAAQGRTFMLFTSYRALNQAAQHLDNLLTFPLLVQGSEPQAKLIQKFRNAGNAVLLGTASFWEGVDIRGDALSCVIIDKLPFQAIQDPVMEARLTSLKESGENPFDLHQLPRAVIQLKQGVGRLIRDDHDRGVLMLGDTRLLSRSYGQRFLQSLPKMPRTRQQAVVERFFDPENAVKPTARIKQT